MKLLITTKYEIYTKTIDFLDALIGYKRFSKNFIPRSSKALLVFVISYFIHEGDFISLFCYIFRSAGTGTKLWAYS